MSTAMCLFPWACPIFCRTRQRSWWRDCTIYKRIIIPRTIPPLLHYWKMWSVHCCPPFVSWSVRRHPVAMVPWWIYRKKFIPGDSWWPPPWLKRWNHFYRLTSEIHCVTPLSRLVVIAVQISWTGTTIQITIVVAFVKMDVCACFQSSFQMVRRTVSGKTLIWIVMNLVWYRLLNRTWWRTIVLPSISVACHLTRLFTTRWWNKRTLMLFYPILSVIYYHRRCRRVMRTIKWY